MIGRLLRVLSLLREERDRYLELVRGGALGDSDMPWPSIDEAPRGPSDIELHEHSGSKLPPRPPLEMKR